MAFDLIFGSAKPNAHVRIEVVGLAHPDVAEPAGMDLLQCRVHAYAPPVEATFDIDIRVAELLAMGDYLAEINSGNGPQRGFSIAGGLLTIAFAPSRRGPVLCAVGLKTIDVAHVRVEYMVTLEPESISRTRTALAALAASYHHESA